MTKTFFPAILVAAFMTITLFSCIRKGDDKYGGDISKSFFPLQFGRYVVYDVDSTLWDDFHQVKTLHRYQMRYTIADTFRDNEFRLSYRMNVHIRPNDTFQWKTHRVIYVTPTPTRLEWVEENIRFIKLVFPVADNIEWKGNSLIAAGDQDYQYFQDWTYKYANFTLPFNDGKVMFNNTVTVNQVDEQQNDPETRPAAYSFKTYGKEVYASDVGMVYREMTHWIYDPGVVKYRKGYSVVMRAVDHN